ncbi:MAG: biopolymer transporter ExbD [Planctomycetota bacterium]
MAAFKSPEIQEEVVANLIPMIDIMFLLLLFFMLGADMTQREFEDVDLAQANSAEEDKKEDADRLTINVHHLSEREMLSVGLSCPEFFTDKPEDQKMCRLDGDWAKHWSITIRSERYPMKTETDKSKLKNKLQLEADKDRDPTNPLLSNRRVQIRADKFAPFGFVRQVMESCASVGIYKLEVSARKPLPTKSG